MISGINEGYANFLGVQRESTLGGSGSGDWLGLDGKLSYSWQPVLGEGIAQTSIWRQHSGDSSPSLYYSGSFQMEFGNSELQRMLLESILETVSVQSNTPSTGLTTYTYRPRLIGDPRSLKIAVEYAPSGPYFLLEGVLIDYIQMTVRLREVVKVKYEWKALRKIDSGAETYKPGAIKSEVERIPPFNCFPTLDGVSQNYMIECSFALTHRLAPAAFGADKLPTRFRAQGPPILNGEWVEYFRGEDSTIPSKLETMTEGALTLQAQSRTGGKKFSMIAPRAIFRSGFPDGASKDATAYRAGFEVQHDPAITLGTEPRIELVI
jgi:hypothetical protein